MAHPFAKIFERALKKRVLDGENAVLIEAEKIIKKGYSASEVIEVLEKLLVGRIDEQDVVVLDEALLELRGDEDDAFDED